MEQDLAKIYSVKEIFYSLQGEGARAGRVTVFCRFSGCNLWNGLEKDRATAICSFCDTDFVGVNGVNGGKYHLNSLVKNITDLWSKHCAEYAQPYVVFTGGEPLLQLDSDLLMALKQQGFETGIETNGTLAVPDGIDWLCVSPKAGSSLVVTQGNELKLVVPQQGIDPSNFVNLDFDYFFIQAMDGIEKQANIRYALAYCLKFPQWRLSIQTHKLLGIR